MNGDDLPRLVFLVLLLMALGGALFTSLRERPGKTLQQISIWALIFLGLVAVAGMWGDIRQALMPRQQTLDASRIELPRQSDGHYYVTARVNGVPIQFVVDTGATQVVLTRRDAERAGIDVARLAYTGRAATANGDVATAPVRIDAIDIGPIHDRDIRAVVNDGQMQGSLLGMSYLTRFARVEFDRDRMILER